MPEDLTLYDVERKMRQLVHDLGLAQQMLREARDAEVEAKHAYERRHRRLVLSPRAPLIGRGENKVTAAERDAWVDGQCEAELEAFEVATVRREAAADHLRTLRDQAMLVTALAKSIQISMGLVGTTEH